MQNAQIWSPASSITSSSSSGSAFQSTLVQPARVTVLSKRPVLLTARPSLELLYPGDEELEDIEDDDDDDEVLDPCFSLNDTGGGGGTDAETILSNPWSNSLDPYRTTSPNNAHPQSSNSITSNSSFLYLPIQVSPYDSCSQTGSEPELPLYGALRGPQAPPTRPLSQHRTPSGRSSVQRPHPHSRPHHHRLYPPPTPNSSIERGDSEIVVQASGSVLVDRPNSSRPSTHSGYVRQSHNQLHPNLVRNSNNNNNNNNKFHHNNSTRSGGVIINSGLRDSEGDPKYLSFGDVTMQSLTEPDGQTVSATNTIPTLEPANTTITSASSPHLRHPSLQARPSLLLGTPPAAPASLTGHRPNHHHRSPPPAGPPSLQPYKPPSPTSQHEPLGPTTRLLRLCEKQHWEPAVDAVLELVREGADVTTYVNDNHKQTILHRLVAHGQLGAVEACLTTTRMINFNLVDDRERTVFHYLCDPPLLLLLAGDYLGYPSPVQKRNSSFTGSSTSNSSASSSGTLCSHCNSNSCSSTTTTTSDDSHTLSIGKTMGHSFPSSRESVGRSGGHEKEKEKEEITPASMVHSGEHPKGKQAVPQERRPRMQNHRFPSASHQLQRHGHSQVSSISSSETDDMGDERTASPPPLPNPTTILCVAPRCSSLSEDLEDEAQQVLLSNMVEASPARPPALVQHTNVMQIDAPTDGSATEEVPVQNPDRVSSKMSKVKGVEERPEADAAHVGKDGRESAAKQRARKRRKRERKTTKTHHGSTSQEHPPMCGECTGEQTHTHKIGGAHADGKKNSVRPVRARPPHAPTSHSDGGEALAPPAPEAPLPFHCYVPAPTLYDDDIAVSLLRAIVHRIQTHPNDAPVDFSQPDWTGRDFIALAAQHQRLSLFFPEVRDLPFYSDRVQPLALGGSGGHVWGWDLAALSDADRHDFIVRGGPDVVLQASRSTGQLVRLCRGTQWMPNPEDMEPLVTDGNADVCFKAPEMRQSILHEMVKRSNVEGVRVLLKTAQRLDFSTVERIDCSFGDYNIQIPLLHYICNCFHGEAIAVEMLKLLVHRINTHPSDHLEWGQKSTNGYDIIAQAVYSQRLSLFWPILKQVPYFTPPLISAAVTVPSAATADNPPNDASNEQTGAAASFCPTLPPIGTQGGLSPLTDAMENTVAINSTTSSNNTHPIFTHTNSCASKEKEWHSAFSMTPPHRIPVYRSIHLTDWEKLEEADKLLFNPLKGFQ